MPREPVNVKRLVDDDLAFEAIAETMREIANEIIAELNEVRLLGLINLGSTPTYDLETIKTKFKARVDALSE